MQREPRAPSPRRTASATRSPGFGACELAGALAESLKKNVRALHRFADSQGSAVADFGPAHIGDAHIDPFFNVNAPADLERARGLFASESARG